MPTIEANGCNFYYELQGQGPDIVFIHGEIHGSEYWEYQIPEFSREYRCLTYNRRGHYGTELTNFGYSLVNQTRDLAALIEKLGLRRPVIIGVAFGTAIAANYAIHEAIIAMADNRWLAQVIGDLRKILKLARLQTLQVPGRLEQSLSEHLAVFAALKARDAEGAEAAMRTHLTRQRGALREVARAQRTRITG